MEVTKQKGDVERGALMTHIRGEKDATIASLEIAKDLDHQHERTTAQIDHVRKAIIKIGVVNEIKGD